jgi:putative ABC transport system permease protein
MNDLKVALRQLLKSPGFTVVAVLTLALGIGANTAIFSVLNAVLLKPLPYPDSDQLVWLSQRSPDFPSVSISYPNFVDWGEQQTVFEHFGVYNSSSLSTGGFILTREGDPQRLKGVFMSSGAFAAMRTQPALGRLFVEQDDTAGAPSLVVLSHELWQKRFGGDSSILNRSITLDGRLHVVVGVMPPGFAVPEPMDLWVSIGSLAAHPGYQDRGWHSGFYGIARLKAGVSLGQARTAMDAVAMNLERQYPDKNKHQRVLIDPLIAHYVTDVRRALWTLLGAVALVLLIACTNVANLLLSRAAGRQKEMAVRVALGASRSRIVRQLLTESLLLAACGAALGLLLAHAALPLILSISRNSLPRAAEIGLDVRVLAFTFATAVCTALVFGLTPAFRASKPDLAGVLKGTARGTTGEQARLRHGLVVGEVALALVLLISAGLVMRSFYRLQQVNPGFVHEHALSFRFDLLGQKYPTEELHVLFCQSLLEKLRSIAGVQAVSVASRIPLDPAEVWQTDFLVDGRPAPSQGERPFMDVSVVSPDYFRVLGIPLLRGRSFVEQDNRDHLRGKELGKLSAGDRWMAGLTKIIVDDEFARRFWPNEDPIGRRVRLPWGSNAPVLEVVGVAGHVKIDRLSEPGRFVQGYLPFFQGPRRGMAVVIKTPLTPDALIRAVRQHVRELDPDLALYDVRTLDEVRDRSISPERLNLMLLGAFAAVALAMAVIGLYGVLAYGVTQRQREIGVRMALGATRRDVLELIVRHGMALTLLGVGIGLAGSFALTRVLATLLYEIAPTDTATFAAVTTLLSVVAFLACLIPARRAIHVDPMEALRYE